jgi:hypothetical protein
MAVVRKSVDLLRQTSALTSSDGRTFADAVAALTDGVDDRVIPEGLLTLAKDADLLPLRRIGPTSFTLRCGSAISALTSVQSPPKNVLATDAQVPYA